MNTDGLYRPFHIHMWGIFNNTFQAWDNNRQICYRSCWLFSEGLSATFVNANDDWSWVAEHRGLRCPNVRKERIRWGCTDSCSIPGIGVIMFSSWVHLHFTAGVFSSSILCLDSVDAPLPCALEVMLESSPVRNGKCMRKYIYWSGHGDNQVFPSRAYVK